MDGIKNVTRISLYASGLTVVSDSDGNQVPEFQKSWLITYLEYLQNQGVDIFQIRIDIDLLDRRVRVLPFPTMDGGINYYLGPH